MDEEKTLHLSNYHLHPVRDGPILASCSILSDDASVLLPIDPEDPRNQHLLAGLTGPAAQSVRAAADFNYRFLLFSPAGAFRPERFGSHRAAWEQEGTSPYSVHAGLTVEAEGPEEAAAKFQAAVAGRELVCEVEGKAEGELYDVPLEAAPRGPAEKEPSEKDSPEGDSSEEVSSEENET
jgi:hypothetical protein